MNKLQAWIDESSTVTDFAKKIGRSRMQMHRYLNGENLTLEIMKKISDATDGAVSVNDLIEISEAAASKSETAA